MWGVLVLLCALCFMGSCAPKVYRQNLIHGHQLSIRLPLLAQRLEFTSGNISESITIWSKRVAPRRGKVMGSIEDRHFIIKSVSFDDQGNYSVINDWNRASTLYLVKVTSRTSVTDLVAGETLTVPLAGLARSNASLVFSNDDFELKLLEHGSLVGETQPEYLGRIQVKGNHFQLMKVNESDEGNYTLTDPEGRAVSIVRMKLVDHHQTLNPFSSLLLLLGIPVGVCCCYREKICKRSSKSASKPNSTVNKAKLKSSITPPGSPASHIPETPAVPSPICSPDPSAGESTVHPIPANPAQPPHIGPPAMDPAPAFYPEFNNQNPVYPPGFTPQWDGAPYNPPAPACFVMYNAPAPAGPDPIRVEVQGSEISAGAPLLPPTQPEGFVMDITSDLSKVEVQGPEISAATPLIEPPQA